MKNKIKQLEEELHEQCLLNGKGSEREAALLAKVERLDRENAALRRDVYQCPPTSENDYEGFKWCDAYEELERENAELRERLHIADAEIDMWASRCASAIWMLPETVTGGQLREAQDKFHRMLHAARKEAKS